MAKNRVEAGTGKTTTGTVLASAKSGDPACIGQIPGVCAIDADSNNQAPNYLDGVFSVSVKGVNSGGNSAVAEGDILYYNSGHTPKIDKDNTGVRWGYARGTVGSGSTATINAQVGY